MHWINRYCLAYSSCNWFLLWLPRKAESQIESGFHALLCIVYWFEMVWQSLLRREQRHWREERHSKSYLLLVSWRRIRVCNQFWSKSSQRTLGQGQSSWWEPKWVPIYWGLCLCSRQASRVLYWFQKLTSICRARGWNQETREIVWGARWCWIH